MPVYAKYNGALYVAISDADRHPALDYVATIHHGIDMADFTFNQSPGSYLAFFGRIHPDKGVVEAIDAAQEAGIPLRIAGIIQDAQYFEQRLCHTLTETMCNSSDRSEPKIARASSAARSRCCT